MNDIGTKPQEEPSPEDAKFVRLQQSPFMSGLPGRPLHPRLHQQCQFLLPSEHPSPKKTHPRVRQPFYLVRQLQAVEKEKVVGQMYPLVAGLQPWRLRGLEVGPLVEYVDQV